MHQRKPDKDYLDFNVEPLETREMLAVALSFNPNSGLLKVSGDAASDLVFIDGRGFMGGIEVFYNGVIEGQYRGVNKLKVNMGAGDDQVIIRTLQIGGSLTANMGTGQDELSIDLIGSIRPVFVGSHVTVNMGGNEGDLFKFRGSPTYGASVGGNVKVVGAAVALFGFDSGDSFFAADDVSIGGNLTVQLKASTGAPIIGLTNINVGGVTTLKGTALDDDVSITDSTFARRVAINLGAGDDFLEADITGDYNRFHGKVKINGGRGNDTFDNSTSNFFSFAVGLVSVENVI
jgi:hypothetical protein